MGRGDRRLGTSRKTPNGKARREFTVIAGATPELSVRRLTLGKLVCTGAAVAALGPAQALTLGDILVDSPLGQPLSARVPVELSAGEIMVAGCVSAVTPSAGELSAVPHAIVSVPQVSAAGRYDLHVSTARPLYEPMYELRLELRCPGSTQMVRQYVLMLDLPGTRPAAAATPAMMGAAANAAGNTQWPAPTPVTPQPAAAAAPSQRPATDRSPLPSGTSYRVQAGDTLSTIAARTTDRGGRSIWEIADAIFAANPDAFIRANPDLIRSGAVIVLPAPLAAGSSDAPAEVATVTGSPQPDDTRAVVGAAAQAPAGTEAVTAATPTDLSSTAPPLPLVEPPQTAPVPEAVFQDEQPPQDVAAAEPVAVPAVTVERRVSEGAPAWLAAVVGVLIGAAASLVLLRERLAEALRGARRTSQDSMPERTGTATAVAVAAPPALGKPAEPTMVVVEGPRHEHDDESSTDSAPTDRQPAVYAAPAQDFDSAGTPDDLTSLFGDEPDLALPDAAGFAVGEPDLDLDLSAAAGDVAVDQDIGWLNDLDETALTPTDQAGSLRGSGGDTVEQTDLHAMSQKALDDEQVSNTLKEALDLLESDYEEDLTASQVVDRARLGSILDDADEEDTLVRTGTDQLPRR